MTLNGKDVTARFTLDAASGEFRGLVEGLRLGANRLMATTRKPRSEASLTVTNYAITGPILSGPHLTPFECSTEASGLGPALDANCSAPRKIWHLYRSTDNTFKPLADSGGPASGGPRDDDDHRRQDRAVHRPRRLGRDQPRHLPARDPR